MTAPADAIDATRLYTAAEVSLILRHSLRWFYRNRRAMQRYGFPSPIEYPGGRRLWSGAEIIVYLTRREIEGENIVRLDDERRARIRGAAKR